MSIPASKFMVTADLEGLVEERISKLGVHLIDFAVKTEGQIKSVELYIDSEEGVTSELCSAVSREIDTVIGSADIVRDSYRLTVSSPGISRPLKYRWQYKKHVGRLLDMKIRSGEGAHAAIGMLESVGDNEIVVTAANEQQVIAFDTIQEARVKAPW